MHAGVLTRQEFRTHAHIEYYSCTAACVYVFMCVIYIHLQIEKGQMDKMTLFFAVAKDTVELLCD
jgi:hypothetical protein